MVASTGEDAGFFGYIPTTIDPGPGLIFATLVLCALLNALLPCFVAFGRHRDKRIRKEKVEKDDPWAVKQDGGPGAEHQPPQSIRSFSDVSQSLRIAGPRSQLRIGYQRSVRAPSVLSFGQGSVASAGTFATSVVGQSVVHGLNGRRGRTQRRFRRALEKRATLQESGRKAESFFRFDQVAAPHAYYYPAERRRAPVEQDDQSFLSKMDTDEVSVKSITMDAENEDFIPKQFLVQSEEDEIEITCCGAHAWWKPTWVVTYFDRVVALSEWDFEMRKIMKLTLPFVSQALFTGLMDVLSVAIIGKLVGTQEVTAYVIVDMLIALTNELVGGFWNALTTLCSQAEGTKQNKLCGQYVQMALLLYLIFSVPFMFLWFFKTEDALLWLGFEEGTAEIGRDFARVYIFAVLVEGISETLHGLLDVIELENYSTVMGIAEDVLAFVLVLLAVVFGSPELYQIGLIHLFIGLFFLVLNVLVISWRGWFKPYLPGMLYSFSLTNYKAVWLMCKTALSLSLGFLLTDGEWEILTLLASFLGPAEVAAWSLLGTLWGAIEDLTEAIGDAAEVRCAFLLGCGRPTHAQVSAYKSMLISTITSFLVTSILFTLGEDVATWLTNDPVLQQMIADLLPLFGLGNITMTVGTVSWTLLGAQGRYRLATTVAFCGSWLVTLPLAVLASVALNLSLAGQTAAVVIGYMVSGTTNAYFLFRSDWEKLSQAIIDSHEMPAEQEHPKAGAVMTVDSLEQEATPSSSCDNDDDSTKSQEVAVNQVMCV